MFTNPFLQSQQMMDAWSKASAEQVKRLEGAQAEYARVSQQGLERAHEAIDEWAKLMKESLRYTAELQREWSQIATEGAKRAGAMWGVGA